jgi:formylmethanofuran dehydrogenase subunit D
MFTVIYLGFFILVLGFLGHYVLQRLEDHSNKISTLAGMITSLASQLHLSRRDEQPKTTIPNNDLNDKKDHLPSVFNKVCVSEDGSDYDDDEDTDEEDEPTDDEYDKHSKNTKSKFDAHDEGLIPNSIEEYTTSPHNEVEEISVIKLNEPVFETSLGTPPPREVMDLFGLLTNNQHQGTSPLDHIFMRGFTNVIVTSSSSSTYSPEFVDIDGVEEKEEEKQASVENVSPIEYHTASPSSSFDVDQPLEKMTVEQLKKVIAEKGLSDRVSKKLKKSELINIIQGI